MIVAAAVLAMVMGFIAWWRAERVPAPLSGTEVLALQVAALDAALERGADPERRGRRDVLATRLAAALAEKNGLS